MVIPAHVTKYLEYCVEQSQRNKDPQLRMTMEQATAGLECDTAMQRIINPGGMDECLWIITNCADADGYFWSVVGYYTRDPNWMSEEMPGPWGLQAVLDFGGDSDGLNMLWQKDKGWSA